MIGALFVREDSIYKNFSDVDCWDINRDARKFDGNYPIIAHPPCRAWGRMRQFSKPREDEKQLALLAIDLVRVHGGILEHPANSSLWKETDLPKVNHTDDYGGYTIEIKQVEFGHRAEKKTWLYIVGCEKDNLPPIPYPKRIPTHCIRPSKSYPRMPSVTKPEREKTPLELAQWLIKICLSIE